MNEKYFFWVSDLYSNTGEGRLAIKFIERILNLKKLKFEIKSNYISIKNLSEFKKKLAQNIFYNSNFPVHHRYLIFLKGIFYLWINYFKGNKIIYVNYLPLWNFLIFLLSPPGTIFGPITGSSFHFRKVDNINSFIRKFLFPLFFKISLFLLKERETKNLFATSLLKNLIDKKLISKSIFDVQLIFKNEGILKLKKKYDLVIYNRDHSNKNIINFERIIKLIDRNKFKIIVLGEKINLSKVKNLGFIKHDKILNYLSKTKYSIISSENIYSFFFLDSLYCKTAPLLDKSSKFDKEKITINNFYLLDFDNEKNFLFKLNKILKSKKKKKTIILNENYFIKISKKFNEYITIYY